jgi:hypothetical protein
MAAIVGRPVTAGLLFEHFTGARRPTNPTPLSADHDLEVMIGAI